MNKLVAHLILFLCPTATTLAQELDRTVLEKVKSASAYVVVTTPAGTQTGSAFLFLKRETTGYLLTCDHVLSDATSCTVVFAAGTPKERTIEAKVLGMDHDRDLACLIIKGVGDLPTPLEVGEKTVAVETQAAFVAGFPFGGLLAAGAKNPEISVSKASISSVRRDEDREVALIQMSGDVNPGNSGGPVVDAKGQVIGLTAAKIRGSGTAFAIPPEQIARFLGGRVWRSSIKTVVQSRTEANLEVALFTLDPFRRLKTVEVGWCWEEALPVPPKPSADGSWTKVHEAMKPTPLKIDDEAATGQIRITRTPTQPETRTVIVQGVYTGANGNRVWGPPVPVEVNFSAVPEAKPAVGSAAPTDPPVKGVNIPVADTLKAVSRLSLKSAISDLVASPSGEWVYALDLTEGKVYQLDSQTLRVNAQAEVIEDAVAMCLSPDGRTIYVGSRDPERKVEGQVQVLSTGGLKTTAKFSLNYPVFKLAAMANGFLVATSAYSGPDGLAFIDVAKKSVVGTAQIAQGCYPRVHPDQARVYTGDSQITPPRFKCVSTRQSTNKLFEYYESSYMIGTGQVGGDFEITPDGTTLIAHTGTVVKLGKLQDNDFKFLAKIDPGISVGVAKGSNTFVVATMHGFLKVYDLQKFELVKSVDMKAILTRVVLDPAKQRIIAVASALPAQGRQYDPTRFYAGDIVSFSLSGN